MIKGIRNVHYAVFHDIQSTMDVVYELKIDTRGTNRKIRGKEVYHGDGNASIVAIDMCKADFQANKNSLYMLDKSLKLTKLR